MKVFPLFVTGMHENAFFYCYMKSNKDFFLGVMLVTLHRWRLTYAYTNNTPVNLYWILYNYSRDIVLMKENTITY
ncbi:hypothetical protein SCACP_08360 [Sporomusa carbonis]